MAKEVRETFGKYPPKQKLAIITATAGFVLGWGLTIAGFIAAPLGEISERVLWALGQALIYAASIFGVTGYFNSETKRIRNEIIKFFQKELNESKE